MILAIITFIGLSNLLMISQITGIEGNIFTWFFAIESFVIFNVFPSFKDFRMTRLGRIYRGVTLLVEFLITSTVNIGAFLGYILAAHFELVEYNGTILLINSIIAFVTCAVIFWNGILQVYFSSFKIGLKLRIIGAILGMIPIVHLFVLDSIIRISYKEYADGVKKVKSGSQKVISDICDTKYPILLVHGVFFNDMKFFNYWGRIPRDLEKNGAKVYYGNQDSTASVCECGEQLAQRIRQIVEETGCEKVNIIAHSKGGLDARAAITLYGAAPYVASLTTINTPHCGCVFADYILQKVPARLMTHFSKRYNRFARRFGAKAPNFLEAITDLTNESCMKFNEICPDSPDVYYQSVGSKPISEVRLVFPFNISYSVVKRLEGPNDGLVALPSMKWGSDFIVVSTKCGGVSHGDMVDMDCQNINDFDVRKVYVNLVGNLKSRGL